MAHAKFADSDRFFARVEASGMTVIDERDSFRKAVKWFKMHRPMKVLEEKTMGGQVHSRIVPCYGAQVIVDDKRKKYGLVRFAKDPQRMYNFWRTIMTESGSTCTKSQSGCLPKVRMRVTKTNGQWLTSNLAPVLRYKQKGH
jgi:hypothetical protein